jgi:sigma-54-interacting transcriptional regulator
MEHSANAVIAVADGGGFSRPVLSIGEAPRPARPANRDLQIVGMRRSNLLLEGPNDAIQTTLDRLWPEPREPILTWNPGQPLVLPPSGRVATLILHDVGELSGDDQQRMVRWLDQAAARVRVVSTTAESLWPRVNAGTFNDVLYYRLNTVCVDVTL